MNLRIATLLVVALASSCAFDPAFDLTCDGEGVVDDGRECRDGVWTAVPGEGDTGAGEEDSGGANNGANNGADASSEDMGGSDLAVADMDAPDADCTPEDEVEFCTRLGGECGDLTAPDNCGVDRTVDCGTCMAPETCGAAGDANVCGCEPETDVELCSRLVKNCDSLTAEDNCGVSRTVDCGTCVDPAVCAGGGTANVCACPDQTDTAFCQDNNAVCGALTAQDVCMQMRTVDCGGCGTNEACGVDNQCACAPGYVDDGAGACVDVDECATMTAMCDANATCTNNDGGFDCTCNAGFTGDGMSCSDVDECSTMTDDCDPNAACTNTAGGFTCACEAGYSGNGKTCTDVNECTTNTDDCHAEATCTNIPGSFTCACNAGYSGNGRSCTDVDECAAGTDNCDANANCINVPGSFDCECLAGWVGNGRICNDVDECATMSDDCDADATCSNNDGGFDCTCNAGFSGDGRTCDPLVVLSVQNVSGTLADGTGSIDVQLPSNIISANAVPFVSARISGNDRHRDTTVSVVLSDDKVTVTRPSSTGTVDVAISVVEFNPARVRVQTTSFSGEENKSITSVDQSSSFILFYTAVDDAQSRMDDLFVTADFSANDSVQFDTDGTTSISGQLYVVEALDGAFTVQRGSGSIGGGNTSDTISITSVDPARSFVLSSHKTNFNSDSRAGGHVTCALSNGTEVSCDRGANSGAITQIDVQVVELAAGAVQRSSTTMTGTDLNATVSFPAMVTDPARTTANCGHLGAVGTVQTNETTASEAETGFVTCQPANSTVELQRGTGAAGQAVVSTELIEWP